MTVLLVLGGARSGKSRYSETRLEALPGDAQLAYIATAQALDAEMAERIAHHRARRGPRWYTIEAPLDLPAAIARAQCLADAVLVDCLTLWLTNLMLADLDVEYAGQALIGALHLCRCPIVLIANEVGLGIVPDNALARRFRDKAGRLNQELAAFSDEVVLVAAGLPLRLKSPADRP
jgi:adenosylcobinamide kinase/adenosylcobinamide-phosphate guanylyltransferase